jgi:hypothetical protein
MEVPIISREGACARQPHQKSMPKNLPRSAREHCHRAAKHLRLAALATGLCLMSASLAVASTPWAWATSIMSGSTPGRVSLVPRAGARPVGVPVGTALPPPASSGAPPRSASSKKANKPVARQHKTAPISVEPLSAVEALASAISAGERQIKSVDAYAEALSFLRRAQTGEKLAARNLGVALRLLGLARQELAAALVVEAADKARVALYQAALVELGVAEYTGQAGADGADLQQVEHQVEMAQLGDVAASDAVTGLEFAEAALAKAIAQVRTDRERVTVAVGAANRAKARLSVAKAQVATSQLALAKAKTWALVAGAAPARPSEALLGLEGPLGGKRATRGGARARVQRARGRLGTSSTGVAGGAAPSRAGSTVLGNAGGMARGAAGSMARGAAGGMADLTGSSPAQLGPTIFGPPVLTARQIVAWFASTGARANTTLPMARLVGDYMRAGRKTGVRADIAFAQSIIETGYFSFPAFGQDPASYNNFAGIGACDSCKHGWKFPSALDGVMVQMALLSEYATPPDPFGAPGGLVAGLGVAGCCRTWMALSGVWASNPNYGYDILTIYDEMLSWALEGELQSVGLARAVPVWHAGVLSQR